MTREEHAESVALSDLGVRPGVGEAILADDEPRWATAVVAVGGVTVASALVCLPMRHTPAPTSAQTGVIAWEWAGDRLAATWTARRSRTARPAVVTVDGAPVRRVT